MNPDLLPLGILIARGRLTMSKSPGFFPGKWWERQGFVHRHCKWRSVIVA